MKKKPDRIIRMAQELRPQGTRNGTDRTLLREIKKKLWKEKGRALRVVSKKHEGSITRTSC